MRAEWCPRCLCSSGIKQKHWQLHGQNSEMPHSSSVPVQNVKCDWIALAQAALVAWQWQPSADIPHLQFPAIFFKIQWRLLPSTAHHFPLHGHAIDPGPGSSVLKRDDQTPRPLLPFPTAPLSRRGGSTAILTMENPSQKGHTEVHLPLEQFWGDSAQLKRRRTTWFIIGHSPFRATAFLQQPVRICREKVNVTLLRLFVVYLGRRRRGERSGESRIIWILDLGLSSLQGT